MVAPKNVKRVVWEVTSISDEHASNDVVYLVLCWPSCSSSQLHSTHNLFYRYWIRVKHERLVTKWRSGITIQCTEKERERQKEKERAFKTLQSRSRSFPTNNRTTVQWVSRLRCHWLPENPLMTSMRAGMWNCQSRRYRHCRHPSRNETHIGVAFISPTNVYIQVYL